MRLAVYVARQILGGPADLEQHLLDPAAFAGVHQYGVGVDAAPQHRGDFLVTQHFFEHRAVQAHQCEAVCGVLDQLQPAVAGHDVDDVDQQRLRNRVPREADQRVDHLLCVVPGRTGVPQRQRGDAIGMHMLGCALELGKRCDRRASVVGPFVAHLEQDGLVGLDDQRSVGHLSNYISSAFWSVLLVRLLVGFDRSAHLARIPSPRLGCRPACVARIRCSGRCCSRSAAADLHFGKPDEPCDRASYTSSQIGRGGAREVSAVIVGVRRLLTAGAPIVLTLGCVSLAWPASGHAAECGPGTIFDPPTNLCLLPPAPPPPPPAPPVWNGDPTPGFSIGICAPIPFVSICTGI